MKRVMFRYLAGPAKFRVMRAWGEFLISSPGEWPQFNSANLTLTNGRTFEFSSLDDIEEAAKLLTEMAGRWKADKHELQTRKCVDFISASCRSESIDDNGERSN